MGNFESWQDIVERKRRQQANALALCDVTDASTGITEETCIENLSHKLRQGQLTAEAVASEYIFRARRAHETTNCLTEIMFCDALKFAKELDMKASVSLPLFGIPVSLKDQFDVQGYDSTLGYVGRAFSHAKEDCALVKILRSLGAVILTKTNLPQSIMMVTGNQWCETENPMFGLTTNPLDKTYTPGGSTGGEAALLAMHGSMLGWGTDIGGSIRIPAHMMGLYGLKPSSARLPYRGVPVSTEGQEHVPSSVGPLARSLSTISVVMKAVVSAEPWNYDGRCVPLPWRTEIYNRITMRVRPLVFGVLRYDGVVHPHPPIARVLDETVAKLKASGHHIVEWDATLHADAVAIMDAFYSADGGEDIRRDVARAGEPFIPHVARLIKRGPPISVYEYWQLNRRKIDLQHAYLDKWNSVRCPFTGHTVDALLLPPMPHTAVPHKSCGWVGYTKVWNVLDYPALVIPAGQVGIEDLSTPWEEQGETVAQHPADTANRKIWTEHGAHMAKLQLPVGVQLVCRKLEEEKLLGIGKVVDELLNGSM